MAFDGKHVVVTGGTGALGDMACHTANLAFRALKPEVVAELERRHR